MSARFEYVVDVRKGYSLCKFRIVDRNKALKFAEDVMTYITEDDIKIVITVEKIEGKITFINTEESENES